MKNFLRLNKNPLLLILTAAFFYGSFAYDLAREDFIKLITLYSGLFFLSWKLIQINKNDFWFLAGAAFLFRLIFFLALPNLSQDFFRFIWDGRLIIAGYNPYLYLPDEFPAGGNMPIAHGQELLSGMGELSARNYTNYPPLNQLIFAIAGILAGKNIFIAVVVLRLIIIAADFGILYFGKKLLEQFNLPAYRIFWFILNPFVIIELTGNLHFEGVMLFLLILSLYLLNKHKWVLSAVVFALSVLLKLLPLLFLPLLYGYFVNKIEKGRRAPLGIKKLLVYYFIVGTVVVIGFIPFLSPGIFTNFFSSISLWFQRFEFNASIYYLLRWVGYKIEGYNMIETVGKILPAVVLTIILILTFFRNNITLQRLFTSMLLAVSIYFFLSTTVHSWYIATPLLLSIFTVYRFAIVWSYLVFLSYFAYSQPGFQENLWLLTVEYLVVIGLFFYESFKQPIQPDSLEDKDFEDIRSSPKNEKPIVQDPF